MFSAPSQIPSAWLSDSAQRERLVTVLNSLFARPLNGRVFAWELFNEPEFDVWSGQVPLAPLQELVRSLAAAVHARSGAYVSIGSANLDGLSLWMGLGLDYHDAHWYDPMPAEQCARCTTYAALRQELSLDRPLVIGEFFAGPEVDALQRWSHFYDNGFAGAWAWSLLPERTSDGMNVDLAASKQFAQLHADIGP
jgi:hypothetical protein